MKENNNTYQLPADAIKKAIEEACQPICGGPAQTGMRNPLKLEPIDPRKTDNDKGLRHNKGKIRYDLLEPFAIEQLAHVFSEGAKKYEDRNWEKGMKWSKMRASLGRHLGAYDRCEDFDAETGLYHIAQVAWNALGILSYYKLYPEGDDRAHHYNRKKKIGLDIDEVLCNWTGAWCAKFGYPIPNNWHFSYKQKEHFQSFSPEELNEFYLNIPAKMKPEDIPFEPHCYITSRSVPVELTQQWIQKNGFPTVPIYSIGFGNSKVEVAKQSGIDWFVDDSYSNFAELNEAGICTWLWDSPHNQQHNVGYKRIKSLKDLL